MPSLNATDILQVRGKSFCIYPEYLFSRSQQSKDKQRLVMRRAKKEAYSGEMSQGAKKRIKQAISMMAQTNKPKWMHCPVTNRPRRHGMSFLTLNIPGKKRLTASMGYWSLLRPFEEWLVKTKGVTCYVWKAEFQMRGSLHYHLATPTFLHWKEVRDKWNRLLADAGFLDAYAQKHKHMDANATDITAVKNPDRAANYMMKELAKDEKARYVIARKAVDEGIRSGKYLSAQREEMIQQLSESEEIRLEVATRRVDQKIQQGKLLAEEREELIQELAGKKGLNDGKIWGCSLNIKGVPYYSVELWSANEEKFDAMLSEKRIARKMADPQSKAWWIIWDIKDNTEPEALLSKEQKKDYADYLHAVREGSWRDFLEQRKTKAFRQLEALLGTASMRVPVRDGWKPIQTEINFN